ncbi:MAG: hypothetical protein AAGK66_07015, partial [Pseudomonadota bacterium]
MNIARLENQIVIVSQTVGVSVYDFDFDLNFQTSHPYAFDREETCILRIGAIDDYDIEFAEKLELGLRLINDPQQHRMASSTWSRLAERFCRIHSGRKRSRMG